MRVSTAHSFTSGLESLQQRQGELAQLQSQITSGLRVQRASDDPIAAAQAERARSQRSRLEADQRALQSSRQALTLGESALGDATELLQQARELMVAAGNPTHSDAERLQTSQQLAGLRSQLLDIANRRDGAGHYLFGGPALQVQPFQDGAGGVTYAGLSGDAQSAAAQALPLAVDGRTAWLQAGSGGGVFATLDQAVADLATPGRSGTQIAQSNAQTLTDLDASLQSVSGERGRLGALLNRADAIESHGAQAQLQAETARSQAEDLDLVQALSDVQNRQTGYEAALKAYASVQRLSLMQLLQG